MRKGISVFIRARDEEQTIKLSLEAAKNLGDQIVFVDNCSVDRTFEIAQEFKEKNKLKNMVVEKFENDPKKREATLSDLYNFTVSLTTGKWLIKWDGDLFLDKKDCDKVKKTILKYNSDERTKGLYMANRVIFRDFKHVLRTVGAEMGAFKWHKGLTYISEHREGFPLVGQALYKQNTYLLANDILHDPIIWHIRVKTAEEFVKSRYTLQYYREIPNCTLEEFIVKNMGEVSYEDREKAMLGESLVPYDLKEHGEIPKEMIELFNVKQDNK